MRRVETMSARNRASEIEVARSSGNPPVPSVTWQPSHSRCTIGSTSLYQVRTGTVVTPEGAGAAASALDAGAAASLAVHAAMATAETASTNVRRFPGAPRTAIATMQSLARGVHSQRVLITKSA